MSTSTPRRRDGDGTDDFGVDERWSDWIDAQMDKRERDAFERELEDDPELRRELEAFQQTVGVLRRMPPAQAPDDFLQQVQSRIRRRTTGRFYGEQWKTRFPYEAAFNLVLLGLMMALYITAMPKPDPEPIPVRAEAMERGGAGGDLAGAILGTYGPVTAIVGEGDRPVFEVTVEAGRVEALRQEIGLYPQLELVGEPTPAEAAGQARVRVRATAR